jgi:hypothetical protein
MGWASNAVVDGNVRLTLSAETAAKGYRLWVATSDTRDFRKSKWEKRSEGKGMLLAGFGPGEKYQAVFAECDFAIGDLAYTLSTRITIIEPAKK